VRSAATALASAVMLAEEELSSLARASLLGARIVILVAPARV
jgi:hypothetical protein